MRKAVFKFLVLLFMVAGVTINGWAEQPDGFDRPPTRQQMEKVWERIETLRMWKLTKALDLDEKASAQLFPLLNRYDKRKAEIEIALRDSMRELRQSLREGREGSLKNILDRLEQNHREMQRINDEEWAGLKRVLTIQQQAKFIIFRQEFDREIRRIITEARGKGPERLRRNGPERPLPPER